MVHSETRGFLIMNLMEFITINTITILIASMFATGCNSSEIEMPVSLEKLPNTTQTVSISHINTETGNDIINNSLEVEIVDGGIENNICVDVTQIINTCEM